MPRCEVVIPYWQREEGVLLRTLTAVFKQTFQDFRVIVVDDESPCPATIDIRKLPIDQQQRIEIIKQKNTKQAGARNRGLEACSTDTLMVALLDSDDVWDPEHLARAETLFTQHGVDFYWASVYVDPKFAEGYALPSAMIQPELRREIKGTNGAFEITNLPKIMSGQWFRHMHLSPTIMSGKVASRVRFNRDFTVAEDFEFLVKCALEAKKPAATDAVGVYRSVGENIWHGIQPTDALFSFEKYYSMRVLKGLRDNPRIDKADKDLIDLRIKIYREQFYWAQRACMKNGIGLNLKLWASWMANDPKIIGLFAAHVFKNGKNTERTIIPGDDQ